MATYNGSNGDDTLAGNIDYDQYNLGEGNNNVRDLIGNNTFNAGSGNDSVESGNGNDTFNLGEGSNTVKDTGGNNIVNTGSGADNITTGDGDDQINAGGGDNVIYAGSGTNRVNTGSGADRITTGNGNDEINAGEGNNWIDAGAGSNRVTTGAGADTIITGDGNDDIYAGEGNNTISAGGGTNHIYTGSGTDKIVVGVGNSQIYSGGGSDDISIGGGQALVYAGDGNDIVRVVADGVYKELWGEGGSDTLEITLTAQQAKNAAVISDIAGFKANKDWTYTFKSLNITARQFENIVIKAPVEGKDDSATTDEDHAVVINVLSNDVDLLAPNNAALHITGITQPAAGSVAISQDGKTVSFDPGSSFQHLAAGQHQDVTFTYTVADDQGFSTVQTVTVTVLGLNDGASISGVSTGSVTEDGDSSANGTLTVSDVDDGQAVFQAVDPSALHTDLGDFTFDASNGNWSFSLDNAAAQSMTGSETVTRDLNVTSQDGTAHKTITVTIHGADDAAEIRGVDTGKVAEDGGQNASGALTVHDADHDQSGFQPVNPALLQTEFGTFSFDASTGQWSFALDNDKAQSLVSGQTVYQQLTVHSIDGTAHTISVAVAGSDDAATFAGSDSGSVTEDGPLTASGILTVNDPDQGQNGFSGAVSPLTTAHGTFSFNAATGGWSFALDNAAAQALTSSDHFVDSLTVKSLDGTTHTINVAVNGADDAAVITGVSTGSVTEDGNPQIVGGHLIVTDPDHDQSALGVQHSVTDLGVFDVAANGDWTFALNNGAAQRLGAGEHEDRSITVDSVDGTGHQVITVTVNGTNDAPNVAAISGSTTESGKATLTASYTDPDATDSHTVTADATSAKGGLITVNGSVFTYDTNGKFESLGAGMSTTDTFSYTVNDGHGGVVTQTATVTINGENDNPTITVGAHPAVNEDSSPLTSVAQLVVNDVDSNDTPQFDTTGWTRVGSTSQYTKVGTYGTATLDTATSKVTYALDASKANSLNTGDVRTDSFSVKVTDDHNGSATANVDFTVNGHTDSNPGSFENGVVNNLFDGWQGTSGVSIYDANSSVFFPYLATDGSHSLMISGGSESPANLKDFLGLSGTSILDQMASDGVSRNGTETAKNGAAAKITIHLENGQSFNFDWLFDGTETSNNDFAFMLKNGVATKLSDTSEVGIGNSGWHHIRYTNNTGHADDVTFAVVAENEGNSSNSPRLFIDHVYIA